MHNGHIFTAIVDDPDDDKDNHDHNDGQEADAADDKNLRSHRYIVLVVCEVVHVQWHY